MKWKHFQISYACWHNSFHRIPSNANVNTKRSSAQLNYSLCNILWQPEPVNAHLLKRILAIYYTIYCISKWINKTRKLMPQRVNKLSPFFHPLILFNLYHSHTVRFFLSLFAVQSNTEQMNKTNSTAQLKERKMLPFIARKRKKEIK